jgi:hypothetical protein
VSRGHEASLAQGEEYISVDIEASGPIPGEYSMLSIGACPVRDPEVGFYDELRPTSNRYVSEALEVSGFSLIRLREYGTDPAETMASFRGWIKEVCAGQRPIFVGYNASFDWAFVNWYFHVFLQDNPFGIGGVDELSHITWDCRVADGLIPRPVNSLPTSNPNAHRHTTLLMMLRPGGDLQQYAHGAAW